MKRFDLINSINLDVANVGDVFTGYGNQGQDVSLTYKAHEDIGWFACFKEINKDGSLSVFGFDYNYGSLTKRSKL